MPQRGADFGDAFTKHLRERFGFSSLRKRLPRLACDWQLEAPPAGIVDFTVFRLEGDQVAAVGRIVQTFFRSVCSEEPNQLFYDAETGVFCSVVLQHDRTAVAVFRQSQDATKTV